MTLRGITRADIRWLLARGIPDDHAPHPGAPPRHRKRGYIGKREAMVAYVEDAHRIRITTVMWIGLERAR